MSARKELDILPAVAFNRSVEPGREVAILEDSEAMRFFTTLDDRGKREVAANIEAANRLK